MNMPLMPTLFVAHSAPTLALDEKAGADYRNMAQALPVPEAILVFSAHWETDQLAFGETVSHDEIIYDFGGFQPELYEMQYPAPGAPELVEKIRGLFADNKIESTSRGIDHGVWVPFLHMWPKADIPILQMSLPRSYSDEQLLALGERLKPLREQNVLIVTTGVITHNLRTVKANSNDSPPDWAAEFDQWVEQVLDQHKYDQLVQWQTVAPHALQNHPTPEHFLPLIIAAGAAQNEPLSYPVTGFEWGSLSRRCVRFG